MLIGGGGRNSLSVTPRTLEPFFRIYVKLRHLVCFEILYKFSEFYPQDPLGLPRALKLIIGYKLITFKPKDQFLILMSFWLGLRGDS